MSEAPGWSCGELWGRVYRARGVAEAGPAACCSYPRAAGKHLLQRVVRSVQIPSPAGCGPHGAWAAGDGFGDGVGAAVARVLGASAGSG